MKKKEKNTKDFIKDLKETYKICQHMIKLINNNIGEGGSKLIGTAKEEKQTIRKVRKTITLLQKENIVKLYHVTAAINIDSIREEGLLIGKDTGVSVKKQDKLFFWDTVKKAKKFQEEMFTKNDIDSVILTVFLPKNIIKKTKDSIYGKEYYVSKHIEATQITIGDTPIIFYINTKNIDYFDARIEDILPPPLCSKYDSRNKCDVFYDSQSKAEDYNFLGKAEFREYIEIMDKVN